MVKNASWQTMFPIRKTGNQETRSIGRTWRHHVPSQTIGNLLPLFWLTVICLGSGNQTSAQSTLAPAVAPLPVAAQQEAPRPPARSSLAPVRSPLSPARSSLAPARSPLAPAVDRIPAAAPQVASLDATPLAPAATGKLASHMAAWSSTDSSPLAPAAGAISLSPSPASSGPDALRKSSGHLNDVYFIDPRQGFVVGDGGLIWRTHDGGTRWNECRSGTDYDLASITFSDDKHGWAVGGRDLPLAGLHEGVVCRTDDGGLTWQAIPSSVIPRFTHVAIDGRGTPTQTLWAVAAASTESPIAIFESRDGGQSWIEADIRLPNSQAKKNPVPNNPVSLPARDSLADQPALKFGHAWIVSTGDRVFSVVNRQGLAAQFNQKTPEKVQPQFRCIDVLGNLLLAIAYDGQLWASVDSGETWTAGSDFLPAEISQDATGFQTMSTQGNQAWIAGACDQRILHFDAGTGAWDWQTLPVTMPIHSLHFCDSQHGWAVGPLGNVFRTNDGGRQWIWQHRVHDRLAVLIIAANSHDIPSALIGQLAANNGLNIGVVVAENFDSPRRVRQAFAELGNAVFVTDPSMVTPSVPESSNSVQRYVNALQPQIVLFCPASSEATRNRPVRNLRQTNHQANGQGVVGLPIDRWMSAASGVHGGRQIQDSVSAANAKLVSPSFPAYQWQTGTQFVMLTLQGGGQASVSLDGFAANLNALLGDACLASHVLRSACGVQPAKPQTFGVRMVSGAENELRWFGSAGDARALLRRSNGSMNADPLSRRLISAGSISANANLMQTLSQKNPWLQHSMQAPINDPELRSQWQAGLALPFTTLPKSIASVWLYDLVQKGEQPKGHDHRNPTDSVKSQLASIEMLQSSLDNPITLSLVIPAISLLVSDEAQWTLRREADERIKWQMAEFERQMQNGELIGSDLADDTPLTEEQRQAAALRRYNIDPELADQVPAEILERIMALDLVQRQAAKSGKVIPNSDLIAKSAVPESKVQMTSEAKNFHGTAGVVQRNTTVLEWDNPGGIQRVSGESDVSAVAIANADGTGALGQRVTILDRSLKERVAAASELVTRCESVWPQLQHSGAWWLMKANLARKSGDTQQVEICWNRLIAQQQTEIDNQSLHQALNLPADLLTMKHLSLVQTQMRPGEPISERFFRQSLEAAPLQEAISSGYAVDRKWFLPATLANQRPLLDGKFDEVIWQNDQPAEVRFAYDEQYLYVAIEAELPHLANPPNLPATDLPNRSQQPRRLTSPRDSADRENCITLHLDTDCDYFSGFQIDVDVDGAVNDRRDEDFSWDPAVFVAQDQDPVAGVWRIEIALDLKDVSLPQLGQPWAVSLQQTRPLPELPGDHSATNSTHTSQPLPDPTVPATMNLRQGWIQVFDPFAVH